MRHSDLNDIIHYPLLAAGVPLRLEPRSDGKRPDGMTLVPWAVRSSDATCTDTIAVSYRGQVTLLQAVWLLMQRRRSVRSTLQLYFPACGDRDFRGDWPSSSLSFESSRVSSGSRI